MDKLPEQMMYEPFFNMVCDKTNWKNPINTVIKAPAGSSDVGLLCSMIERAIAFYAGGGAKLKWDPEEMTITVKAPGYYAQIGA